MRVAALSAGALLALAVAGVSVLAFRTPGVDLLPLPADLIAADSGEGRRLLAADALATDHASLDRHFESQSRPAYCGVASSVMVLNALRGAAPRLTQATFFTDAANRVRSSLAVTFGGMSLAQLADLLRSHGVEARAFFASDTSLESFRSVAAENLGTPGDFILVNYQREVLGQGRTGHISPLGAYHPATDRLLVLDVAAYKYPPVWVPAEALWNAMNTVDGASGRTRGFVVVGGARSRVPAGGAAPGPRG